MGRLGCLVKTSVKSALVGLLAAIGAAVVTLSLLVVGLEVWAWQEMRRAVARGDDFAGVGDVSLAVPQLVLLAIAAGAFVIGFRWHQRRSQSHRTQ